MAYDERLASRVRRALARRCAVEERAMFGGLAFMVRGHMCCGLVQDKLMVRIDPNAYEQLLSEPGVRPMDFTGRPMRGFLYVTGPGIATPSALNGWLSKALDFAESRPPKSKPSREMLRGMASKRPTKRSQPSAARRQPTRRPGRRG